MQQTIFYIPHEIGPLPVFGPLGWLSIGWILFSVVLLVWLVRRQGWNKETQSYLPMLGIVWLAVSFLLPMLVETHRGVPIRGYGMMLLLAVLAGVGLAAHRAQRMGIDPEFIFSLAFVLFITAIIGARTFYVIEYWHHFQADTAWETIKNVANVTQGGLVIYGCLIGGLAGGVWYLRARGLPVLAMGDLIAPSMVLGLAIGRIGCLLNGCCFGGLCDQPWAVTFPFGSPPYMRQQEENMVPDLGIAIGAQKSQTPATSENAPSRNNLPVISAIDPKGLAAGKGLKVNVPIVSIDGYPARSVEEARSLLAVPRTELRIEQQGQAEVVIRNLPRSKPVHPTQIYSSINGFLIFLVLFFYYPFRRHDGEVMALMLTLYAITRFLLEWIRNDEPGTFGTPLTISQWVSVFVLATAIALWFFLLRRPGQLAFPPKKAMWATGG